MTTTSQPATDSDPILNTTKSRSTATHVFFYGGTLSNWHLGTAFPGSRALSLLLTALDNLEVDHPSPSALSSQLINQHMFNCGEQWMMCAKAWLFEQDTETVAAEEFEKFQGDVLGTRMPKGARERRVWEGSLCRILRERAPRRQKGLGRRVGGFDGEVWDRVGQAVVTVGCVVRAEADAELRRIYLASEGRGFVEGSPRDVIWGVGIHWTEPTIEDPALWLGENRLGLCHDEAAGRIREAFGGGVQKSAS